MAGITPRTLHFYDEIGLLKPSHIGDNGYRYYGEEAVLRLQQILLYRKLDVPLDEIKRIMLQHDFDITAALLQHRAAMLKRIDQLYGTVATIDKTLSSLKGEEAMDDKQIFVGISDEQQEAYEQEAMQMYDPEVVKASNLKWKRASVEEKTRVLNEGQQIYLDLVKAMPEGPESEIVQRIIERWRQNINYFWTPQPDQLLGLAQMYNEDPRFKAFYDRIHPALAEFILSAVKVYVSKLKK